MHWQQEPGFQHKVPCCDYVQQQIRRVNTELIDHAGKLDLVIVDACWPNDYQQGQRILVTNNWLAPGQLDPARYEKFPNSWYGMYAGSPDAVDVAPTQCFNCFINRVDPVRQSWLYQLLRRGLFDKGYISVNMDISRHVSQRQCLPDTDILAVFDQQFEHYLKIFQREHDFIRPQMPYRNFESDNLTQTIMSSKFSIILETYFDNNEVITFSEKIFRCLKLPRPWILFAQQHAVQYLRDMGFDVLDDVVDHSYDSIEFGIDRQIKLLDVAEQLCNLKFDPTLAKRTQQAADHNCRLLSNMFDICQQDIFNSVEKAKQKCLAL
jgi:hypothetical protein